MDAHKSRGIQMGQKISRGKNNQMKKELTTEEQLIERREGTKKRIEKKLSVLKESYETKKAIQEKRLEEVNIELKALKK